MEAPPTQQRLRFFVLSDFGHVTEEVQAVVRAMDRLATEDGPPDFILGLGDNFYPYGVYDEHDKLFDKVWRKQFLKYASLRVPWRMVLGNHDYMGSPTAQVDYHYSSQHNADGLWYMPDTCYDCTHMLSIGSGGSSGDAAVAVTLFALDTNACQSHVVTSFPQTPSLQRQYIQQLHEKLQSSSAHWKIVFGHHPMYTQGKGHGVPARCLRDSKYVCESKDSGPQTKKGFGLEQVVVDGHVDAYFAGHEHVFQHHVAKGIHHFCCGASGADMRPGSGLYRGRDDLETLEWVGRNDQVGFVVVDLTATEMWVRFLGRELEVFKEVRLQKPV